MPAGPRWYLFCICVVIWILCHLVELNVYHLRADVIIIKPRSPDQNNQHNYQCFRNKSVFPCPTSATTSLTKNSVISNQKEWWWWCWWQYLRRQLNKNFFGWLVQYQNNFLQIKYPKKILFPDITSAISKEPFSDITSAISKGRSATISVQTGERYRVFFHWFPPKSSKYKKVNLG